MGEHIVMPLAVIASVCVLYYNRTRWSPKSHKKHKHKKWYQAIYNVEKLDKKYQSEFTINDTLKLAAISILIVFLGLRTGMGFAVKDKIKNKNLKIKNNIEIEDGKTQNISLLGQNSLCLFYVEEGDTRLTISPIENNVKKIIHIEPYEKGEEQK